MKKHNSTAGQRKATWAALDNDMNPQKQLSCPRNITGNRPACLFRSVFCHGAQFSLENNGTEIIGGRIPVRLLHPHEKCRINEA